jgi:VIT1/CCC1 family predicted Fe2+/Mn2+ transporter
LLLDLDLAAAVAIVWGFLILGVTNFLIARAGKIAPWKVIGEHFLITLFVIIISYCVGNLISASPN